MNKVTKEAVMEPREELWGIVMWLRANAMGLREDQYLAAALRIEKKHGKYPSNEILQQFIETESDVFAPEPTPADEGSSAEDEKPRPARQDTCVTHGGGDTGEFEKKAMGKLRRSNGEPFAPIRAPRPELLGLTARELLDLSNGIKNPCPDSRIAPRDGKGRK